MDCATMYNGWVNFQAFEYGFEWILTLLYFSEPIHKFCHKFHAYYQKSSQKCSQPSQLLTVLTDPSWRALNHRRWTLRNDHDPSLFLNGVQVSQACGRSTKSTRPSGCACALKNRSGEWTALKTTLPFQSSTYQCSQAFAGPRVMSTFQAESYARKNVPWIDFKHRRPLTSADIWWQSLHV